MMLSTESSVIKSSPYFLSTLSSKSVPENGDTMFSCKVSGNPKPEVTWYRNGQDINEQKDISVCEILEDNVIHVLHLFRCTEQHTGVYQIMARNCFGTVQSSAFLKVTPGAKSELYQELVCSSKDEIGTYSANKVDACQWEYSNQVKENKEALAEKNVSSHKSLFSLDSSEPPVPECNGLFTEQPLGAMFSRPMEYGTCSPVKNQHQNVCCLGGNKEIKKVPNLEEKYGSIWDMSKNASSLFINDNVEASRDATGKEVDDFNSLQVDSKPASQITDHTNSCYFNAKVLAACQTTEYAKTHEERSLSTFLEKGTPSRNNASTPLENQTCFLEDCCRHADNNFELHLGRNFITPDESFDDDHLEYLECSDVMTEEAYQKWENKLKFLLESDDEDELNLGSDCDGCAYFLSEMPRLFQVSDNTVPMDATIGFCGHPSKSKEVAVRSDLTAYSPSTLQTGMTLTVGQQQTKTSTMKDKEKYKLLMASTAIENDYPRIEEENSRNNCSAADSSVGGSEGIENGRLEMESSSCDLGGSSATTETQSVERGFPQKNSQQLTKVREKLSKGKANVSVTSWTKASKDPLHRLHPKELHTSEICTVQMERSCLNSAEQLNRHRGSISSQACQAIANASNNQNDLFHGGEGEKNDPWEDKWISGGLSGRNLMPNENSTIMKEKQEADIENGTPSNNELKLHITEPELDDRFVFTSFPVKSVSVATENSVLEKVSGNGFPMDIAMVENSTGCYVPDETCDSDVQGPCWDQTFQVTPLDYRASHGPYALDHTDHDILTPVALSDRQTKRVKACGETPHEVNEVKTVCDTPCTEYVSKVDFQTTLESEEPEARDADLSSMQKQLQKLLYEEDDWGCDFTCTSSEVKSLAAETDTAKEVEGLNVTGDVSTGQHVPGNLTEDNQLVTELAMVMKGYTDFNSLLKTDEACSSTSMGNSFVNLPVELDAMCQCSALGRKTEEPSVTLLTSDLVHAEMHLEDSPSETQPDHNKSIQTSTSQEGAVTTGNALQSCEAASQFKLTVALDSPLEDVQAMLSDVPANYLGQLSFIKQNVHCTDGPIAKQADEMPAKESHVTVCHSRIKECTNLAELSLREDSYSNFSGKNTDQFASEEHSSLRAVDKSTEAKFQEKGTESDVKAQSDSNCGIYHVLRGSNSKNFQSVSDAQNYGYCVQEHNSAIATESNVDQDGIEDSGQDNRRIDSGNVEPVFKASYKVRYLTELLLEINKNGDNCVSHERRDFEATAVQTAPESKHALEMPSSDSQQREGKSSVGDDSCEIVKGLGKDSACIISESGKSATLNNIQPSNRNGHSSMGQDCQNENNTVANYIISAQDRNQPKTICKDCCTNSLVAGCSRAESLMQIELMQIWLKKDKDAQTPEACQGQYQNVEEKIKTQIDQYERGRHMSAVHDLEGTEVEPYMQPLLDSEEEIYSWHDSNELQTRYQKLEEESNTKIPPREENGKENQKSMECDLEEAEVEPYMRALINSEEIYSWHNGIACVHPYIVPSNEQIGLPVGGLVGRCVSTGHSQSVAFTACESPNLNLVEHAMGTLVSISPCASENSHHSQEHLPQGKIQPCTLAATVDDPCTLKEERAKSQEAPKLCKSPSAYNSLEDVKRKQEAVKKKMVSKVQVKKPRLEAKENVCNYASCLKKVSKAEAGLTHKEDKKEQQKLPCKTDNKAPQLLKKIQAELVSDFSGNIKLWCQFGEINEDSTITWTKDSKLLARVHRSAGDDFPVSLAIVQAGKKDQGMYYCCMKNTYGKATAEFNLTAEVLEHLSSFQNVEGLEDIEFLQLMFREDFINDSYFSNSLHGSITTEELHFGEGVHRKAFRSKVMQGLVPVFRPGHPCVLKVHSAIVYGTKNNDELVKKNYKLALQECYVQNTAREYAKIYAAETKPLEGFGEVPEIIPIFLIHRPKNNIPYATVEEELIGEFVKYSIKDGKEINFSRRDSEAGQKCCTFQHWVYERTSGSLLITDMQGVGMKLTDVGIATLAKGYKGFKGNCSISFIDQFKVLHQCNRYCEMLGLKPLQTRCQKQRKPAAPNTKAQSSSSTTRKTVTGAQAAKKT